MVDRMMPAHLAYRALFVAVAGALLFVRILPLSTLPSNVPGPDLLLCVTFAWLLRRPDYVPAPLIAAVFLVESMLVMRPPGLWAAIVLLGAEFMRRRVGLAREVPFPLEWALVAVVIFAMMLAERLVLALAMVPQAGLRLAAIHLALTVLAYPLVAAASVALAGVRKVAPGEMNDRGHRL